MISTDKSNERDWMIWAIIAVPFIYLASIWSNLPQIIPIHFNIRGEPDSWGSKYILIYSSVIIMGVIYLLFKFVPLIDPKKSIDKMGNKFFQLQFVITSIIAVLCIFIMHSAKVGSIRYPYLIFSGIGVMFMILGNYFPSIKPNYFMGVRTPWTLESEECWRKTHRMSGKLWVAGGLIMSVIPFILRGGTLFFVWMGIVGVLVLCPVIYSYRIFKEKDKDLV